MATNFPLIQQQQRQGNPLLGTVGSAVGGALGGTMGGPLGAAAGKALGGQLLGQGTVDPMAGANQVLQSEAGNAAMGQYIVDPLKKAAAGFFAEGGAVDPATGLPLSAEGEKAVALKAYQEKMARLAELEKLKSSPWGLGEFADEYAQLQALQGQGAPEAPAAPQGGTQREIAIPEWTKGLKPYNQDKSGFGLLFNEGGSVWDKARGALGFSDRNKKLTGGNKPKSAQEMRKVAYKANGGKIGHTPGDDGFMSAYETNKVGPLAGVKYKQTDGKVTQEYEKKFHNPLAAKPSTGGSDK